ncbi:hypothetical protein [Halomonas denitrificans]|nr:hypothetical protein [Halomonas denitrificans]
MPTPVSHYRIFLAVLAVAALGACSFGQPTLQETRELELSVDPGSTLVIEAGAGPLTVTGDDGDAIRVEAGIYQRSANDDYRLVLEVDGDDGARLVAEAASNLFGSSDYIDLSIRVPRTMRLRIDDGSGSIRISSIDGDVEIEDGSGSITAEGLGGDILVEDGSGSISIEGVAGDVTIDDGSGSIDVRDVGGTVTVSDGSGGIDVRDAGDFELLDDGSGGVELRGIRSRREDR